MKILVLVRSHNNPSNQDYVEDGKVPELPPSIGQYFWVKSLRELKHDVKVITYTDIYKPMKDVFSSLIYEGKSYSKLLYKVGRDLKNKIPNSLDIELQARNKQMATIAEAFEPDLTLIVGAYDEILPKTVEKIKDVTKKKLFGMNGVGPHDWAKGTVDRKVAPEYYDVMFVNDRYRRDAWQSVGVNSAILPLFGCDPEYVDRVLRKENKYNSDVSFVGSPYPRRIQYLQELAELNIDLKIYGPDWFNTPLEPYHSGEAWGPDLFNAIYNSKISINIHHRTQLNGGNMKMFEIPASKTMQISDTNGENWFKKEKEIITVETPEELKEAVIYYLENKMERKEIATNGSSRVRSDHTYMKRMKKVINAADQGGGRPDNVVHPDYLENHRRI